MHHKDTTWNQHGGVGATLLDNWVEERAVGAARILKERDVRYISERGHADILIQDRDEDSREKYTTVCKAAYQPPPPISSRQQKQSQRKTVKEQKWSEKAIILPSFVSPPPAITYQSTTSNAYSQPEFQPYLSISKVASASTEHIPEHPLTFWSHLHNEGAHTVYGTTPKIRGNVNFLARFGKHVEFSTPISENLKAAQKP